MATPPNRLAVITPFNRIVFAVSGPMRKLIVCVLSDPGTYSTSPTKLADTPDCTTVEPALMALAPPLKIAQMRLSAVLEVPNPAMRTLNLLVVLFGVMVTEIICVPSVDCGTVSSKGMIVVRSALSAYVPTTLSTTLPVGKNRSRSCAGVNSSITPAPADGKRAFQCTCSLGWP